MNINTVRSALIKRAGLFDDLGDKLSEYNAAKAAAQPGAMAGKWLRGKLGIGGQPQQQPQQQQSSAQQPQATQSVQQPAGNALPQDAQQQQPANPVAQQNEDIMNMYKQTLNTIKANNAAASGTQTQPQQTGASPLTSQKQPNYMAAVGFNNQK